MFDWTTFAGGTGGGILAAWAASRFARPAQQETASVQALASGPALLKQGMELLAANAALQTEILAYKNTIETLNDRMGKLETDFGSLQTKYDLLTEQAKRVPELEAQLADLRQQLVDKQRELERTAVERDLALRAQEVAEAGLKQAQHTITEKVISCP